MKFLNIFLGKNKKSALIRELLELRMAEEGFADTKDKLRIKSLGKFALLSTPEGTIVTIIETVIKLQKRTASLHQILHSIENHRKRIGHSHEHFDKILESSMSDTPGMSVIYYCIYRISLEYPGILTDEQVLKASEKATSKISDW